MRRPLLFIVPCLALALGGCLAKTAIGVVTAPVRIASQAADWATTSQDEADRARGREVRRREEDVGRLERNYQEQAAICEQGDDRACRDAVSTQREIDRLRPGLPLEPRDD